MTNKRTEAVLNLRERAEEKTPLADPMLSEKLPHDQSQKLLYELRVHQVELEMQNEELRRTQHELEALYARYFNLYDLAPVGYLTVSKNGLILEANLTITTMLGVARSFLLGKRMSQFIFPEDQDVFYKQRKRLNKGGELQNWEMRLKRIYGSPFWVQLRATLTESGELWITLNDITERKCLEEVLQNSNNRDISTLKKLEEDRRSYISHLVEAIEQERFRTSRELHDDIGQKLTILSFAISRLKQAHPAGDKDQQTIFDMQTGVDRIMESLRRICTNLRPALLEELGLSAALKWLSRDFSSHSGIPCAVTLNDDCCIYNNMECQTTIFRIVQESLNNTLKHASASRAGIFLDRKGDAIYLEIKDDGCGITTIKRTDERSFGIIGMRERAHSLGAKFEISSNKEGGTSVKLVIPCKEQEETDAVSHC